MRTKSKSRIAALVLAVSIMATMFVGYVSATEVRPRSPRANFSSFSFDLPAYGTTQMGAAQEKETANLEASFEINTVSNKTGYSCFLNVRSKDGRTVVGYQQEVPEKNWNKYYSVAYCFTCGYGEIGESYRPSGQTYSRSPESAYIAGEWEP